MEQLEQIADGYFISRETKDIAIKPHEVTYGKYFLMDTLGKAEYEELGVRLIEAAQKNGTWVGMDYVALKRQLVEDMHALQPTFSVLGMFTLHGKSGNACLSMEIKSMRDAGYLNLVKYNNKTVLMPTQKLVDAVYKAQKK
jgi:hypothetical protein